MISGAVEVLSTLHNRFGLMQRIIDHARENHTPVIQWCLMEVLERCPAERECASCPLWEECRGAAKTKCDGFFRIDDAIRMKHRVSRETWESEMMCLRPSITGCVFPSFNQEAHVREQMPNRFSGGVWLAIDFGFANPFVCLWIADDGTRVHVIDEYWQEQCRIEDHLDVIRGRKWGEVTRIACDPAGNGRNDQTAASNVTILKRAGFTVRSRRSTIVGGLELIRAALRPAAGEPTLFVHPRCKRLIRSMESYRYPDGGGELPVKDGVHDHAIDALRYFFVNRKGFVVEGGRRY